MSGRNQQSQTVSSFAGRYYRTIGKILNPEDRIIPKKFLLGTDPASAEVANRLLEILWGEVVREYLETAEWIRRNGGRLGDQNAIVGNKDYASLRQLDRVPVWRAESLLIAEAIRKGQRQIEVQVGDDADAPSDYVERIDQLRRTYRDVIAFVPQSPQLYAAGQAELTEDATRITEESNEEIQRLATLAQAPLPTLTGHTLYQALDAYAKAAVLKNPKESGQREATCCKRLKNSHPDIPLAQFGISAMESMTAYWANRPTAKWSGKPMALTTITNHLKTTKRFIRWLHRTDAFQWVKPTDAEAALRVRVQSLRSPTEIAALRHGVAVWTISELTTLFTYATDRERLLILLGLNCGFAQSEICTLRKEEVVRSNQSAAVHRVRPKSQVYGQFVLWPETIAALDWFLLNCRGKDGVLPGKQNTNDYILVTRESRLYDRQRIANLWYRLLDRIQVDIADFRRLSFKYLRKTAGQLIRQRSNGEIAGIFLCHGQAVASDELADAYTNRPFDKVASAIAAVHIDLKPLFDAVPDPFTREPGSSPNLSRQEINEIIELKKQGMSNAEIVRLTKLAPKTVQRWIARSPM